MAREHQLEAATAVADGVLEALVWYDEGLPGFGELEARAGRLSLVRRGSEELLREGRAAFEAFRYREAAVLLSAAVTADRRDEEARELWRKCLFILGEDR